MPLPAQSRSRSAHDSADSRQPSAGAMSSLRLSAHPRELQASACYAGDAVVSSQPSKDKHSRRCPGSSR